MSTTAIGPPGWDEQRRPRRDTKDGGTAQQIVTGHHARDTANVPQGGIWRVVLDSCQDRCPRLANRLSALVMTAMRPTWPAPAARVELTERIGRAVLADILNSSAETLARWESEPRPRGRGARHYLAALRILGAES
jgi:DNA-binding transcriptional regulator YiaG